jgi:hypothetical protein
MTVDPANIQDMTADELKQEIKRQRNVKLEAIRAVALCSDLLAGKTGQIRIGDKVLGHMGRTYIISEVIYCGVEYWRYKVRKCGHDGTPEEYNTEIWPTPLVKVED